MSSRLRIAIFATVTSLHGSAAVLGDLLSPSEAEKKLEVAEGLAVKTFAADPQIVSISNIDVDHRGRVWACEGVNYRGNRGKRPEGDRILILEDTDGDGVSDKTTVFYQGTDIDIAMGLCVLGNKAIVSVSPHVILLEDTDGDDKADRKTTLLTSDAEFQHDHSLHSFVFGPDGRFYANFGNTGHRLKDAAGKTIIDRAGHEISDQGKPYWGGMVFRCDRDFTNFEVLGHNFRNNYEATVDSFGRVWQSDNDDDGNLAVRLNFILEGGNYGYLDEMTGQRWRAPRIGAHPFRGKRHWHQNDPGSVPNVIETGNGAPTGVTIYEGNLLPEAVQNEVIFCEAGGHLVWSLPVESAGAGFTATKFELLRSPDKNFRPIDAAVAPDGSLFISDWYDPVVGGFQQKDVDRGRIYWIAPEGHKYRAPEYDLESAAGAVEALQSPNYCARYLAWTRLHELGASAEPALLTLLESSNPRQRARALWLLGQIPGRGARYIARAAADRDAEVRALSLRIATLIDHRPLEQINRLSRDPSPRVRASAALLLRHHDTPEAAHAWAVLASQHDGQDRWYLEALGIGAEGKWNACMAAWTALEIEQPAAAVNDLYWRSRGTTTPRALADIIRDAGTDAVVDRYLRAFDFQSGENKKKALIELAFDPGIATGVSNEALQRVGVDELSGAAYSREKIVALLTSRDPNPTSLRIIRELKLEESFPWLLEIARRNDYEGAVDALNALLDLGGQGLILRALKGDDEAERTATARVLARSPHPTAVSLLLSFLDNTDLDVRSRKQAAREFGQTQHGATRLLARISGDTLPEEFKQAVAGILLTHRDAGLRTRAEELFPLSPASNKALPKLATLMTMKGDPASGRKVFFQNGQCATCHQVADKGKAVGPNLSEVGTKLARSALYEAVLYPSAAISHEYENYSLTLKDGTSAAGVIIDRNRQSIQLRDVQGNTRTFPAEEVTSIQRLPVSLMPASLHQLMTTQEFVDLVEFMTTLKADAGTD